MIVTWDCVDCALTGEDAEPEVGRLDIVDEVAAEVGKD